MKSDISLTKSLCSPKNLWERLSDSVKTVDLSERSRATNFLE